MCGRESFKEDIMIIKILQSNKALKTIELTTLQLKSIQLTNQPPEDYLANKLERILEFALDQAKQKYAKYKLDKATDEELEAIADEIADEEEDQQADSSL